MEGFTISELSHLTGLNAHTVKARLYRAGIKPVSYAGPTALYDKSVLEIVKANRTMGRPKKDSKAE